MCFVRGTRIEDEAHGEQVVQAAGGSALPSPGPGHLCQRASLPIMSSWTERRMGRGACLQRWASTTALCADRPEPGPGDPMTLRQRRLAGDQPRFFAGMFLQDVDLATATIRIWKFRPCRRSVLAPQGGVDLEDAMGEPALNRPQLRQRRRDEFRRRLERRHALHVVANIGQRIEDCLKIKQRHASFWVKNTGHVLPSGYFGLSAVSAKQDPSGLARQGARAPYGNLTAAVDLGVQPEVAVGQGRLK